MQDGPGPLIELRRGRWQCDSQTGAVGLQREGLAPHSNKLADMGMLVIVPVGTR